MSIYNKQIIILWLSLVICYAAQAQPFPGQALLNANLADVQNLITQSGAKIIEDSQADRFGSRIIRIQGGSLPDAPVYTLGNFSFDNQGKLNRYNIWRSINTPDASGGYNNRLQALSAAFKTLSQNGSTIRFSAPEAIVTLTIDRNKNEFMEDWQHNANAGQGSAANQGGRVLSGNERWQIAAQCARECPIGSCNAYPSGLENYDAGMNTACRQKMNQCMQECTEEYSNGR
jgi:hypothetical protein